MKSSRNGPSVLRGGDGGGRNGATWFSFKDSKDRPCSKLSIRTILFIVYCWAADLTIKQTHFFLSSFISARRDETLVDWRNFIREVLVNAFHNALAMGGPGEVVEIDETCFR